MARKQRKSPGMLCVETYGREMGDKFRSSMFCQGLRRYQMVHAFILPLDVLLSNTTLWQAIGQAQGYPLPTSGFQKLLVDSRKGRVMDRQKSNRAFL